MFMSCFRFRRRLVLLLSIILIIWIFYSIRQPTFPRLKSQTVYIAALFHNNIDILPQWIDNLLLITPYFSSVYISIHENGSDDGTAQMLQDLAKQLTILNIPHNITTSIRPKLYTNRITYLASLRNDALYNFYLSETHYDKVVFFNDIIYNAYSFLRMVEAPEINGEYDAICGLDYMNLFYDEFATRESFSLEDKYGGLKPHKFPPHVYDRRKQSLIRSRKLTPVFSCWNGVAVFNSLPFYQLSLKFRSIPFARSHGYDASECCLIYADMFNAGFRRVFIDPSFIPRYRWLQWDDVLVNYLSGMIQYVHFPQPAADILERSKRVRIQAKEDGLNDAEITCIQ